MTTEKSGLAAVDRVPAEGSRNALMNHFRSRAEQGSLLSCKECGATRNSRGEAFTAYSLKLHQMKAHAAVAGNAVACDLCGETKSRYGKLFSKSTMLMHRSKNHPYAAPYSSGEAVAPLASAVNGAQSANGFSQPKPAGKKSKAAPVSRHTARFCPECGCNLEVVNAALSIASGEGL